MLNLVYVVMRGTMKQHETMLPLLLEVTPGTRTDDVQVSILPIISSSINRHYLVEQV